MARSIKFKVIKIEKENNYYYLEREFGKSLEALKLECFAERAKEHRVMRSTLFL